jgi:hypothetical protein
MLSSNIRNKGCINKIQSKSHVSDKISITSHENQNEMRKYQIE